MTGVTAGQAEQAQVIARAFHETYETLAPQFGYETREASAKPWEEVPEQNRKLMAATVAWLLATGEIAAQQPQPAPGDAQLRMAIAFIEQARDGAYGDLGTVDAEQSLREIADAAPAQPAPELAAVTSNRLGHALAALREIRDAHEAGAAAHDTAHAALDDDAAIRGNVQLTVPVVPGRDTAAENMPGDIPAARQPAGVGTAWRLLDEARGRLAAMRALADALFDLADGDRSTVGQTRLGIGRDIRAVLDAR